MAPNNRISSLFLLKPSSPKPTTHFHSKPSLQKNIFQIPQSSTLQQIPISLSLKNNNEIKDPKSHHPKAHSGLPILSFPPHNATKIHCFLPSLQKLSVITPLTDGTKTSSSCPPLPLSPTCTKITPSLSQALVHYATSNITPQQTLSEISVTLKVLSKKSPCNFLVFGLGHDSLMWASLNHGGHTVFLEEDKSWIQQIKSKVPNLESYHVTYETKLTDSDNLFETGMSTEECKKVSDPRLSECQLAHKGLPSEVYDVEWDLIMVDAPTGYFDGAPGRMEAIYTAGLMARNREDGETDVFVHDVNRVVEYKFSKAFLCEGYLREQEGRLRHFTIPSHRARSGRPFCP